MTIGCNIWMKLNWFIYGLSRMLQFSQFVWTLSYLIWDVFNNFLLIDATDRSKISSDQKRFFIALSLCPFHFSRTLPLNVQKKWHKVSLKSELNNTLYHGAFSIFPYCKPEIVTFIKECRVIHNIYWIVYSVQCTL